jgi:hypothetical protein
MNISQQNFTKANSGVVRSYRTPLTITLDIPTLERVDDIAARRHIRSRVEAIRQLIEMALYIESKIGLVEQVSSDELQGIREQIETGQIVDYFAHMELSRFTILANIISEELKNRGLQRVDGRQ